MQYYESKGLYLQEHKSYFTNAQTHREVIYLKKILKLSQKDKILDAACGHGRHALPVAKLGFNIEGVDSSKYLINLARIEALRKKLKIVFHLQSLEKLSLRKKYSKIFLMFADFGVMNGPLVIRKLAQHMDREGLLLLDVDSIYRLQRYFKKPSITLRIK